MSGVTRAAGQQRPVFPQTQQPGVNNPAPSARQELPATVSSEALQIQPPPASTVPILIPAWSRPSWTGVLTHPPPSVHDMATRGSMGTGVKSSPTSLRAKTKAAPQPTGPADCLWHLAASPPGPHHSTFPSPGSQLFLDYFRHPRAFALAVPSPGNFAVQKLNPTTAAAIPGTGDNHMAPGRCLPKPLLPAHTSRSLLPKPLVRQNPFLLSHHLVFSVAMTAPTWMSLVCYLPY